MKQLNCWVDDTLAAQVEQAATEDDRSVSAYIRRLLVQHLKAETETTVESVARKVAAL